LYPWFKLHLVSHYKAKRKRAAEQQEQQERAKITAASNKMSLPGALASVTAALGVARAGTPYQSKGIPADITPLESTDSDNSVAANASGDSDSDSVRDSNFHTIIQKWKASDKRFSVSLFSSSSTGHAKIERTRRYSDSDGDGDHKLAGTSLGGDDSDIDGDSTSLGWCDDDH
jgi:hypothetical protein